MMSDQDNDKNDAPVPYGSYLRTVLEKGLLMGKLPVVTTDPNKLEEQAEKTMEKKGFDYIRGGAGENATMDANRLAFRQWKIVPRVLAPTTPRDLSVTLFGQKYGMIDWPYADSKEADSRDTRHSCPHGADRRSVLVP